MPDGAGGSYQNRIVGHGTKRAGDFLAHPYNARLHPQFQRDVVDNSLDSLGWFDEVIENVRTGHVVDGHLRVTLALMKGEDEPVPYMQVDLSEAEEAAALAIKDPSSALAGVDPGLYATLVEKAGLEQANLRALMAETQAGLHSAFLANPAASGLVGNGAEEWAEGSGEAQPTGGQAEADTSPVVIAFQFGAVRATLPYAFYERFNTAYLTHGSLEHVLEAGIGDGSEADDGAN